MIKRIFYAVLIVLLLSLVLFNSVAFSSPSCDTSCDTPTVIVTTDVPPDTATAVPQDTPVPSDTPQPPPTATAQPTETVPAIGTATDTAVVYRGSPTSPPPEEHNKKPKPTQTPNMVMPDTGPFDDYNVLIGLAFICIVAFTGARIIRRLNA